MLRGAFENMLRSILEICYRVYSKYATEYIKKYAKEYMIC